MIKKTKEIIYNILTENFKDTDIPDEKLKSISDDIVKNSIWKRQL